MSSARAVQGLYVRRRERTEGASTRCVNVNKSICLMDAMKRLSTIQFVACAVVLLTVLMAEVAAWLLEQYPASETLWYLNLVVFRPVQQVMYLNSPLQHLVGPFTGILALLLLAGGFGWMRSGRQLGAAVVSHVCLLVTFVVARGWALYAYRAPHAETASLDFSLGRRIEGISQADAIVVALVITGLVAALAGHLTFLLPIVARFRASLARMIVRG
jgi:hypothetical protein